MPTDHCAFNCGDTCYQSDSPYHQKKCPYVPNFSNTEKVQEPCPDKDIQKP